MKAARRTLWSAGAPARLVLTALIRAYRWIASDWLGGQCRFYPSCSHYAEQAVRVHGALRGTLMAAWRVARCGPFTKGGVDHVPAGRHEYDGIIRTGAAS